jgi:murein DD-endopeptidase MepM/ murein hydrolase activator NlpD
MQKLKSFLSRLSKNLKFSITNPATFKEVFSFNSNLVRVFSLGFIVLLSTALLSIFLSGGFDSLFNREEASIKRSQLEEQSEKLDELYSKIESQENYINNIKSILNAEVQHTLTSDTLIIDLIDVDVSGMDSEQTVAEQSLSKQIKEDMSTGLSGQNKSIIYFGNPVTGVVSQEFDAKSHPGIDVITEKEQVIKSCLAGTVVYVGFTRKDGNVVIVEHQDGYISIYKHNKRVLKKIGAKLQLGDPISIVGNTGENSDGPHLHFELWHDQKAINPQDYMSFKH